jgi:MoxR-like ATPase
MSPRQVQNSRPTGAEILLRLQRAIGGVIRGKDEAIRLALTSLFAQGHLLVEDVPGVGKTTLARALARSFRCAFQRIQFTSDLMPSDVTGMSVYNQKTQEFEFRPGPIFANFILADEINRTTPKTQSALLEAMNESQVTVDDQTYPLPRPFIVIATQNPAEHHGAFPIPESQRDRFLMRIEMGYPSMESEKEILRASAARDPLLGLEPIMTADQVVEAQEEARQVWVEDELLDYLMTLVEKTRRHPQVVLGVSPRGSVSLHRAGQAWAFLDGRDYCIADDFKRLAIPVFAHRLVVSAQHSLLNGSPTHAGAIVKEIIEGTPVPL